MVQKRNAVNAPSVRINITIPLPDVQQKNPENSNCLACDRCSPKDENPLLQDAVKILVNMLVGDNTQTQVGDGLKKLDMLVRQHYGKEAKCKGGGHHG